MALTIADRIYETSTSTGTGNMVLAGAVSGYRRFQDAFSVDSGVTTFPYVIEHQTLNEWELGISYLDTTTQVKRAGAQTVLASSNSNSPVNFSAGDKKIVVATNANFLSNLAKLNVAQAYTKQQYIAQGTLTDATNISWNLDNAQVAKVTLGGDRVLSNPTNMKAGGTYILHVYQDGTGSRLLTFDTAYIWADDTPPVLSTSAGYHDILTFVSDGTNMYGSFQLGYTV